MQPNSLQMEVNEFREHPDDLRTDADGLWIDADGLGGRGHDVGPLPKAAYLTVGSGLGRGAAGGWEWPSGRLAAGMGNTAAQIDIIIVKLIYYIRCIRN